MLGLLGFSMILTVISGGEGATTTYKSSTASSTAQTVPFTPSLHDELVDAVKAASTFDGTTNRKAQETLGAENLSLAIFDHWAELVGKGKASSSTEDMTLAKDLERKASVIQTKEFPLMRKIYGKQMHDKLWENDIIVSTVGPRNETLRLVGAAFVTNQNIKKAYEAAYENLLRFRFERVEFAWYEGGDWTYFPIAKDARYRKDGEMARY